MRSYTCRASAFALLLLANCSDPSTADVAESDASADARANDAAHDETSDTGRDGVEDDGLGFDVDASDALDAPPFVVITINAGTTPGLGHNSDDRDQTEVYSDETANIVDEFYHNSLTWLPAERRLTEWLAEQAPAIVGFQELFYDPWCALEEIPVFVGLDLLCETYVEGAPLQIERLLGPSYQIACGTRKEDTCLGIHRDFGVMEQCSGGAACIGGLDGNAPPSGCTSRDRAGRVLVTRPDGRS